MFIRTFILLFLLLLLWPLPFNHSASIRPLQCFAFFNSRPTHLMSSAPPCHSGCFRPQPPCTQLSTVAYLETSKPSQSFFCRFLPLLIHIALTSSFLIHNHPGNILSTCSPWWLPTPPPAPPPVVTVSDAVNTSATPSCTPQLSLLMTLFRHMTCPHLVSTLSVVIIFKRNKN